MDYISQQCLNSYFLMTFFRNKGFYKVNFYEFFVGRPTWEMFDYHVVC